MAFSQGLLRPVVSGHLNVYAFALALSALGVVFAYLPPYLLRSILDSGLGSSPWSLVEPLQSAVDSVAMWTGSATTSAVVLLFAFSVAAAFLAFAAKFGAQNSTEAMARQLRERLFHRIQSLPYRELEQIPTGDWVQRCTSDVDTLRRTVALQFPELVVNVIQASLAIPILFLVDARLATFAIPLIPVVLIFSTYFFSRIQKAFLLSDESEGRLSGILQENVTGVRVVKAFARQKFEIDRFTKENRTYRNVTGRLINLFAVYWGCVNAMAMIQMGMILVAGIVFVIEGKTSVGTAVMFSSMTGMLIWPIRELGRILTDMGKAQVSWTRIKEILQRQGEAMDEGLPLGPLTGRIEFRRVSADRGTTRALDDVSFTIDAGSTVAVLGPTGSGKSTLVSLIAGLLDYEGEIFLDGRELRTIPKSALRDRVGLVLQETHIFAKTIGENIALAHHDAQMTEIVRASTTASLHDVVEGFEHGYDTLLGERGVTLSGGQRQRTSLAQMIVRPRPILIFDDALSAVDNKTDAQIRQALAVSSGKTSTVILISHRVSTISQADRILVLEKGRLVQNGTHEELLRTEGLYRSMVQLQENLKNEWSLGPEA